MCKQASIGEIADVITGKTPPTNKPIFWEADIPFITPKDLQASKHIFATERRVSSAVKDSFSKQIIPAGSVCVSCIGNLGYAGVVETASLSNQQINTVVPNDPDDSDYLYYAMRWLWPYFKHLEGQSTALSIINKSHFEQISIPWPSQATRRKISGILNRFDDLIELNLRTNDYLDELGQTLLGEFISSCSGVVPLGDIMDFGNGFAFKSDAYIDSGSYKVLTIKNVQDGSVDCSSSNRIEDIPPKMKDFCKLKVGDAVLSLTGNVGRVGIVAEENCLLNQRVAVLQPYDDEMLPGLYFFFRQKAFQNEMIGIAKGTAQANLSPIETLRLEIPYDRNSFNELCKTLAPVYSAILANRIECLRLTDLRDSLIPKLMSGEIDVSKVDLTQLNNHLSAD